MSTTEENALKIIDHIGIAIADFECSKAFYDRCLAPLGVHRIVEIDGWAGYGYDGKAEFWFGEDELPQRPMHIAFAAGERAAVDAFYRAGMTAGARDNGAPGIRAIYHPHYYGAFLIPAFHHYRATVADDRLRDRLVRDPSPPRPAKPHGAPTLPGIPDPYCQHRRANDLAEPADRVFKRPGKS
jgi:catechol 2,3-dioxygenase-like lactoylglutathione lyase family enzyme